MGIISMETWNNMSDDEKSKIRQIYDDKCADAKEAYEHGAIYTYKRIKAEIAEMELFFDKEYIHPTPTINTWTDICVYKPDVSDVETMLKTNVEDSPHIDVQLLNKIVATYKIDKLIELGYGGKVTDDEWADDKVFIYFITLNRDGNLEIDCSYNNCRQFIAFHTKQQAEKFISYKGNAELVEQYYRM